MGFVNTDKRKEDKNKPYDSSGSGGLYKSLLEDANAGTGNKVDDEVDDEDEEAAADDEDDEDDEDEDSSFANYNGFLLVMKKHDMPVIRRIVSDEENPDAEYACFIDIKNIEIFINIYLADRNPIFYCWATDELYHVVYKPGGALTVFSHLLDSDDMVRLDKYLDVL